MSSNNSARTSPRLSPEFIILGNDIEYQNPDTFICEACWTKCFHTTEFSELCRGTDMDASVAYQRSKDDVCASAEAGCGWCGLILYIVNNSKATLLDIELVSGIRKSYLTPAGNNLFFLLVNDGSVWLTAYTDETSVCADIVTARPLRRDITSNRTYREIRNWLKTCPKHQECRGSVNSRLPTRLIEINDDDHTPLRLVETKGLHGKYVALSYCWGTDQPGKTTKQNFRARLESLDIEDLSQTVQDAVEVISRLGLRHLWVDALCIIQDSGEDMATELVSMATIYRNAHLTIVAANASDATNGFLHVSSLPQIRQPVEIPFWSAQDRLGSVFLRMQYPDDGSGEPVNSRAWTYQESLLSSRLLIYATRTLQFQCQQTTVNLGNSALVSCAPCISRLPSMLLIDEGVKSEMMLTSESLVQEWKSIISHYTRRTMTEPEDKLVALAALAETFQPHIKEPYLAGIWSGPALPYYLLWHAAPTFMKNNSNQILDFTYIAPSWSWAACNLPIAYIETPLSFNIKPYQLDVLSATTTVKVPKLPYGKVSGGSLLLHCFLKDGVVMGGKKPILKFHDRAGSPPTTLSPTNVIGNGRGGLMEEELSIMLDHIDGYESLEVMCLALVQRSNDTDGKYEETVIDGLVVERVGRDVQPNIYRRLGVFYSANKNEFEDARREVLSLE